MYEHTKWVQMNKLEQAARQALEALEEAYENGFLTGITGLKTIDVLTALREALDHSGEANEMVIGWDRVKPEAIASDPLYQQGFVDGVEEGRNQVAEQAEQEPVAWMNEERNTITWDQLYPNMTPLYAVPVRTKDLTEYELDELRFQNLNYLDYARAVIAADRRKNK